MFIAFFDIKGIIAENWVFERETTNQQNFLRKGQKKEATSEEKCFSLLSWHISTHSINNEAVFDPETYLSTRPPSHLPDLATCSFLSVSLFYFF